MLADAIARPLTIILERSWQSGERKKGKCHGHFQEGQGGASRELLAYQPNLSPQEDYGARLSGSHVQAHEGQEGDWEQPAWMYHGQIVPDQSDHLLW